MQKLVFPRNFISFEQNVRWLADVEAELQEKAVSKTRRPSQK